MPASAREQMALLSGGRCGQCDVVLFPWRLACRRCGKPLEDYEVSPLGALEAFTTVHVAAPGFDAPYRIGYVRLEEGPRVLVQLTGLAAEELYPGELVVVRQAELDGILSAQRAKA